MQLLDVGIWKRESLVSASLVPFDFALDLLFLLNFFFAVT
jgi:hypothetical protein